MFIFYVWQLMNLFHTSTYYIQTRNSWMRFSRAQNRWQNLIGEVFRDHPIKMPHLKNIFEIFIWKAETERYFPFASSLSKCPQQPRLGQSKARSLEPNPGLPCGCQGLKYLGHHLLPPRVLHYRKLESEEGLWLKSQHSDVGYTHPKWHLNCGSKCLPQTIWYL